MASGDVFDEARKAAGQGHADAQYYLGIMYDSGQGMPKDGIQAYAWVSVAAAQSFEHADEISEMMTFGMTRAEIAEAQKLSREYLEAFGPGLNTQ